MVSINELIQILNLENRFLQAVAILAGFFILAQILVYISQRFLAKFFLKTKTKADDIIFQKTHRKISFLLILIGIKLAMVPLGLNEQISMVLQNLVSSVAVIVIMLVAVEITNAALDVWGKSFAKQTHSKVDDQILHLTQRFSKTVFFLLAGLFILQTWDVRIGPLLASLGIAGLAIAFALQSSLGNIFGGISLILDKSIRVGDRIELDTGETGVVKDVGLRSTKIRTWSNQILVVPNGKLADSKIINYIRGDRKTRAVVSFGVAYGTDLKKVQKLVISEIKKIEGCQEDPAPDVYFKGMGDFSLNFDARFWMKTEEEVFMAKQEANTRIYNALNKAKINIPFPTRTIHMKK